MCSIIFSFHTIFVFLLRCCCFFWNIFSFHSLLYYRNWSYAFLIRIQFRRNIWNRQPHSLTRFISTARKHTKNVCLFNDISELKTPHIQPFGLFVAHGQLTNKPNTISLWHSRPSNKGRQNNEIQHTERRFPLQFYNKNLFFFVRHCCCCCCRCIKVSRHLFCVQQMKSSRNKATHQIIVIIAT